MTYTCNNTIGTTTPATISASSGCTINQCTIALTTGYTGLPITINHSQNSSTINCATGYSKNVNSATYTCNNTATTGSVLTINPNHCALNTCTIANATGDKTHNTAVTCDAAYGIVNKKTVYAYCPTNGQPGTLRTAQNGGGSVVSCQKIFDVKMGDLVDEDTPLVSSYAYSDEYGVRYIKIVYGANGNTCEKFYWGRDYEGYSARGFNPFDFTKVGNGICGDPARGDRKKAQFYVGNCLIGYCLD
jgi:hypothetical protein